MERIIYTFRSRTEINLLSTVLTRNGIGHRVINTPFSLGVSCGLSVISDVNNFSTISQIASQNHLAINGIFKALETTNGTKYTKMK